MKWEEPVTQGVSGLLLLRRREKPHLTPPSSNYTPKDSTKRPYRPSQAKIGEKAGLRLNWSPIDGGLALVDGRGCVALTTLRGKFRATKPHPDCAGLCSSRGLIAKSPNQKAQQQKPDEGRQDEHRQRNPSPAGFCFAVHDRAEKWPGLRCHSPSHTVRNQGPSRARVYRLQSVYNERC